MYVNRFISHTVAVFLSVEVSCLCRAGRGVEGAFGSDAKHCCGGSVDARENVTHPALFFIFMGCKQRSGMIHASSVWNRTQWTLNSAAMQRCVQCTKRDVRSVSHELEQRLYHLLLVLFYSLLVWSFKK